MRQRRRRPFALSLPSAVRSNASTGKPDAAPGQSELRQTSYPSLPKDEKRYRCGYVLATLRISNRIEPGSRFRRKLKVASRHLGHTGQNTSAGEARAMSCKQAESKAFGSFFYAVALQGGEILARWLSAILLIVQATRAPLDELQRWIRGARAILR
jgi:hypothetical protein